MLDVLPFALSPGLSEAIRNRNLHSAGPPQRGNGSPITSLSIPNAKPRAAAP